MFKADNSSSLWPQCGGRCRKCFGRAAGAVCLDRSPIPARASDACVRLCVLRKSRFRLRLRHEAGNGGLAANGHCGGGDVASRLPHLARCVAGCVHQQCDQRRAVAGRRGNCLGQYPWASPRRLPTPEVGGLRISLARVRDVLGLIVFGAVLAMGVTATNGVLNLALAGVVSWSSSVSVWWVWWVGDAMGVLLVAPVILTWPPILKCDGTRRSFSN